MYGKNIKITILLKECMNKSLATVGQIKNKWKALKTAYNTTKRITV